MFDVSAPTSQVLLRSREAARALAISERSLYSLRKKGLVRAVSIGTSRGLRYSVADLHRFIAAQTEAQQ